MPLSNWYALVPPLALPIGDKVYEIPPVDLAGGALLEQAKKDGSLPDGMTPFDSWKLVLGPVFDEMVADDIPDAALGRAGITALLDYRYGREMAERFWELGSIPKALTALAEAMTDSTNSTDGESESKTPPPASTPSTPRLKAPSKKPAKPSSGRSS